MMPNGISIGLRSSQGFGNMLLSMWLDHYIKDRLGWKFYYRYCDDITAVARTKKELWRFRNVMHIKSDFIGLTIKPDECVRPMSEGLDALGYKTYQNRKFIRKRTKQNFARKIKKLSSKRRRRELTASFYGQCKHGDCRNLFYILTGVKMKDFKDLKIKPKYQDNKKRFNVETVTLKSLRDSKVIILDYEKGVIPGWQREEYEQEVRKAKDRLNTLHQKYGNEIPISEKYVLPSDVKKPEGRYVVLVEDEDGERKKFFTGDKEFWSILDQAEEMKEIPFRTTIKGKKVGNSLKFYFE